MNDVCLITLVRKAQEEKKAAEERIKAAYDSIPAEYHKFIILLDKNAKQEKQAL